MTIKTLNPFYAESKQRKYKSMLITSGLWDRRCQQHLSKLIRGRLLLLRVLVIWLVVPQCSFISGTLFLFFLRLLVVWRALVLHLILLALLVSLVLILILRLSFLLNLWVFALLAKGKRLRHRRSMQVGASYTSEQLVLFCSRTLHKDLLLWLGRRQ